MEKIKIISDTNNLMFLVAISMAAANIFGKDNFILEGKGMPVENLCTSSKQYMEAIIQEIRMPSLLELKQKAILISLQEGTEDKKQLHAVAAIWGKKESEICFNEEAYIEEPKYAWYIPTIKNVLLQIR